MMGLSTIEVAASLLDEFIKSAEPCGFVYLGKAGYNKDYDTYTVRISGSNVPNVAKVTATFYTQRVGTPHAVEFTPVT